MSLKIGVVGTGSIAKFHFDGFQELNANVAGIADLNREATAGYLEQFSAEYYSDFNDLIKNPDISAIAIFTSSGIHYTIAKAALEAGKHVICEKTLTLDYRQSLELAELAKDKGLCLYASYMKRFFPAVVKAKELMSELGDVFSVYTRTYQGCGANMLTGEVPAFFKPSEGQMSPIKKMSGGGVLICGGSHIFDLILHLVGKPSSVYGRMFTRENCDADFMTHAMFDYSSGAVAHFEGTWHPYHRVGFEKREWEEVLEINATKGRLIIETPVWNRFDRNAARISHYDNESGSWTDHHFDSINPFAEAERFFLDQIEKGEQGEYDPYVGYRCDYLLEMTRQSADKASPMDLNWED